MRAAEQERHHQCIVVVYPALHGRFQALDCRSRLVPSKTLEPCLVQQRTQQRGTQLLVSSCEVDSSRRQESGARGAATGGRQLCSPCHQRAHSCSDGAGAKPLVGLQKKQCHHRPASSRDARTARHTSAVFLMALDAQQVPFLSLSLSPLLCCRIAPLVCGGLVNLFHNARETN